MEDVACTAGVGTGTLYRRFGDRAGLALALLEEDTREFQDALISGPPPLGPGVPAAERLRAFGEGYIDLMERHAAAAGGRRRRSRRDGRGPFTLYATHLAILLRRGGAAGWTRRYGALAAGHARARAVRALAHRARLGRRAHASRAGPRWPRRSAAQRAGAEADDPRASPSMLVIRWRVPAGRWPRRRCRARAAASTVRRTTPVDDAQERVCPPAQARPGRGRRRGRGSRSPGPPGG